MSGLSFLSPVYLVGLLAIAVPVLLHLFRRRTEVVVEFPAVRLLTQTPVEQQRRKRLRELILLALRVTALALLALAFARPYLAGRLLAADTPVTVVAVDRSFSLSAAGVFDRARELAVTAVDEAPANHAVALVAFDDAADLVVTPTTDRATVRAAIRGLRPTAAGTRYAAALSRAADAIGARAGAVAVVTDLQQAGWDAAPRGGLADDITVRIVAVETTLANLAVTSAERRGARVEAVVRNFGFQPRTTAATLAVGGAEVARTTVTVPAQGLAPLSFDAEVPGTGSASVTVIDDGGVVGDDVRYLVLDPPDATRVLVLVAGSSASSGLYVERALEAVDEGRAFTVTVLDGRGLSAWTPEQMTGEDALMVLGTRTLDRRGRELVRSYLAGGGSVLLAAGPDIEASTLADVTGGELPVAPDSRALGGGGATLVLEDNRHPVLRPFATPAAALGDVVFQTFRPIDAVSGRVLARFSGGPAAIIDAARPTGRLLLLASDLDNRWNRFPLSPAFVPFVVEAARYLTDARRQPQSWVLPAVPAGVPASPGVHPSGAGGSGRMVAVNVDPDESNPAAITEAEFLAAIPRHTRTVQPDLAADARQAEDEQRLWQWGLLVMFVALAGEGLVGRRAT
jgi:hypothetical protein